MAVAQGYGKTITSGSVFAYDTGDSRNSYIGEPTTNLALFSVTSGITFNADYAALTSQVADYSVTYRGRPSLRCTSTGQWNIYKYPRSGNYTATSSTAFTFSWKMKWSDGRVPAFTNGYIYTDATYFYPAVTVTPLEDGWYLCQTTSSGTSSPVNLTGFTTTQYGTCYIADWQVEAKSHATSFTPAGTTRSATQGLLPLVGNSTIDLSNVSFDSNAQLIWDGTDDTLAVSDTVTHKPNTSFTYEIVFKPLGGGTFYDKMLIGKLGWHTGIMYQYSTIWFRTRYGSPAFYDTSGYSVTQGNYYHAVATYTSNTSMKFYVNGTLIGENNSVTTPLFDIGDTLNIGGNSVNYSSYVEIPAVKTYNRALSAAEVKQNYLHYKTRFNLS